MRRALALLVPLLLLAGCTKPEAEPAPEEPEPTPASPPGPSPTPSPTARPSPSPSPTPAPTPTPTTPQPTTPSPTPVPTKRVNWTVILSVGESSALPVALVEDENCVRIPGVHVLGGTASATWGGTTPLAQTSLDLVIAATSVNASASGPAPLSLAMPEVPGGEETTVAMYLTDPTVPARISVSLTLAFDIPEDATEPAAPEEGSSCERPA